MYARVSVYVCARMYIPGCARMCVCMYVYVRMYARVFVHAYVYFSKHFHKTEIKKRRKNIKTYSTIIVVVI